MLPERLPLFPLSLVLYPDEPVPLHIFEPRYRKMIARCMLDGSPFGMVYVDEREEMAHIGCTALVKRVLTRYEDGRLDVLVVGGERFRVVELSRDGDLLTADVEPFGTTEALPEPASRERMITQHMKLLELAGETIRPALYQSTRHASFAVAPSAGLEREDKQKLLEMATERERVDFLVGHLRRALRRLERARRYTRMARGDGWPGKPPEVGGGRGRRGGTKDEGRSTSYEECALPKTGRPGVVPFAAIGRRDRVPRTFYSSFVLRTSTHWPTKYSP